MNVYITEVAPRDGLQNIKEMVETERKIKLVDLLSDTGVDEIEVSSFVNPKWIPQLSDAEEVFKGIRRRKGVIYSAIVPNEKGFERAMRVKVDKISVLTAASDTFNRKNINTDIKGSFNMLKPVVENSKKEGIPVRGYVSTAFWCPYEGKIEPFKVREVVYGLFSLGVDEVSLGDTIGRASPRDVAELLQVILKDFPSDRLVLHFHATYGMGIANALFAHKEFGIFRFDSSAGGLGGCPYAPNASGNIATEDLVFALKAMGTRVEVDEKKVIRAVLEVGLPLNSNVGKVFSTL